MTKGRTCAAESREEFQMSRHNDDDNFETVTIDGKPSRILKDGGRVRISLQMRDAVVGTGSSGPRGQQPGDICTINGSEGRLRTVQGDLVCVPLKSTDAKPQFTDGRSTDPTALNRPGFRVPVVNDRRAVHDAYATDASYLRNRYKCNDGERLCEDCGGEGYDEDGTVCDTCNGDGVIDEDDIEDNDTDRSDNPDPISDSHKHRQTMDRLYRERDLELTNAWRKP
jgi:hypothetical protein